MMNDIRPLHTRPYIIGSRCTRDQRKERMLNNIPPLHIMLSMSG